MDIFTKSCIFAKNTKIMKKERIIEFCVDNFILSALLIAFTCILCVLFGDVSDDYVMKCEMSKSLFCLVSTAFNIFITYVFYHFKKFNKKSQKLLSCINGIIVFIVLFIFSKTEYSYTKVETEHIIYIFISNCSKLIL